MNSIDVSNKQHLTTAICGTVQLFISSLCIDFLQCLLPSQSNRADTITSQFPLQLTDVTGDFAVTADVNYSECGDDAAEGGNIRKRSNLVRLPQHLDRAGYSGSIGCHEILYLPARPDKQYPVDGHMAISRSILNFLYIYPRLIRSSPRRRGLTTGGELFTIRIQVLHSDDTGGTDKFPSPIACFYNHASWDGASLVSSVYTNLVDTTRTDDDERGMSIQNEIKVRLPEVLDGNYNVEFTLFSLKLGEVGIQTLATSILATSSIPLTSTRSDDTTSNTRGATIVPNGKHRLELGNYQLHFETRIFSSIHISEPVVAASILEFSPEKSYASDISEARIKDSHSSTYVSWSDIELQLASNKTSMSSIVAFFQVLFYMNLHNLVKASNGVMSDPMEHLRKFYLALTTINSYFSSRHGLAMTDHRRYKLFVKSCEDLFDESNMLESEISTPTDDVDGEALELKEPLFQESHGVDDFEVDFAEKDCTVHNGDNQQRFSWRRWKSQLETNLSVEGVPFSRVPFDTSNINPLKPGNEFQGSGGYINVTALYDDDDTIVTNPSIFSTRRSVDTETLMKAPTQQETIRSDASANILYSFDDNSVVRHEPFSVRPVGDTEFVKRVKNAAAIIIAPCVAPSFANVLQSPQDISGKVNAPFQRGNNNVDSNVFSRTVCLCDARIVLYLIP